MQQVRKSYYNKISADNLTPLWEILHALVTPTPIIKGKPAHWDYSVLRKHLMEAGTLITAEEAIRRVLILENPEFRGDSKITNSLYAGLQLILPGEVAPSHRHSQSALRFIIEGSGAYTAVDGEKTIMHPGDFIITPAWTWHDHGSEVNEPVIWLDGLDIELVHFFGAGFAEDLGKPMQDVSRPEGDALARYGSGLLPIDYKPKNLNSPVFNYPYTRTREALETLRNAAEWDPWHGIKLKYVNPITGGWAMPSIATSMQLLPKDFKTLPYRSTDATVYVVVEGSGKTVIGDQTFHWKAHDVFTIPNWTFHYHEVPEDAVLFSYSDRVVQEKIGIWREEKSPVSR
ncbi:MAG: gentisate 1,2-dioxygenase [Gammaproteobacteria bacterium]|nr:gentisate 1,2-dioxygenase [Gammaproteobacteria bacterium]